MSKGSGGSGTGGRSGGGGGSETVAPAEVWAGNGNGQPRPGDTGMTAALRAEYETNPNIRVSVTQYKGGVTVVDHGNGTIRITDNNATVVTRGGKRYAYGKNRIVDALKHFESLGGGRNLWK